jgi:hypothetical protein
MSVLSQDLVTARGSTDLLHAYVSLHTPEKLHVEMHTRDLTIAQFCEHVVTIK